MYRLNVWGEQRPLEKEKKNESLNKQHITRFQLTFVEKAIVSVARRTRRLYYAERKRKKEREGKKKKEKKKSVHFLRTMTV